MTVWPQGRNEKKNSHSRKKEGTAFIIIVLIFEEEKHNGCGNIEKPQQIRYDKYLAERNIIVQRDMYKLIMFYRPFQMAEPYHINGSINQKRNNMFVFLEESFHVSSDTFPGLRPADNIVYETYHSRLYTKVKITFV